MTKLARLPGLLLLAFSVTQAATLDFIGAPYAPLNNVASGHVGNITFLASAGTLITHDILPDPIYNSPPSGIGLVGETTIYCCDNRDEIDPGGYLDLVFDAPVLLLRFTASHMFNESYFGSPLHQECMWYSLDGGPQTTFCAPADSLATDPGNNGLVEVNLGLVVTQLRLGAMPETPLENNNGGLIAMEFLETPEPATAALILGGLLLAAVRRRPGR